MYHVAGLLASALGFGSAQPADGDDRAETLPLAGSSPPPALYEELAALDQPLIVCLSVSHRVEYWIDLGRRMFAAKGLSIRSDTFVLERTDDDANAAIMGGSTDKGTPWRVVITRPKEADRARGYVVDVAIGAESPMRRSLYGWIPSTADAPVPTTVDGAVHVCAP